MENQAIILAAGFGKRLRPLTFLKPKPMLSVCGKPLIYWIIKILQMYNFSDIIVTTFYKKKMIKKYLKKEFPSLTVIEEEYLYGRAYALKNIQYLLDRNFLVIDGDTIVFEDLSKMFEFHKQNNVDLTLGVISPKNKVKKRSVVAITRNGKIQNFYEKIDVRKHLELSKCPQNGGVYILKRKSLKFVKDIKEDLSYDLIPKIVRNGKGLAYPIKSTWYEFGSLGKYIKSFFNRKLKGDIYRLEKGF